MQVAHVSQRDDSTVILAAFGHATGVCFVKKIYHFLLGVWAQKRSMHLGYQHTC
jgi:hypothetical protein